MKITACMLLLAAAAWGQQVAVPQGGSLGASSNLSDAATLAADKVDGRHSSQTAGPNLVPASDSSGKIAAGWIPLPTASSIGGILMDADCLAGNHVNGIDLATGRLKCSADSGGDWNALSNKPASFPPSAHSHGEDEITNLVTHLAEKAPIANPSFTGVVNAADVVAASSMQVGSGTPAINFDYGTDAPAGACTAGVYWQQAASDTAKVFRCVSGVWQEEVAASSALGDPGTNGVLKRTALNTTGVAARADIVGLWTACSGGYLKQDGTCSTPTAADVGLGNVSNTSDAAKPVSTAQQTALDAKLNASVLDADTALAANSDSKVATQKATKAYVDAHVGGSESTPALSEPSTGSDAGKVVSTKPGKFTGGVEDATTTDQSMELSTASSPQVSAATKGKFSFQNNKMMVSENGGAYDEVAKLGQITKTQAGLGNVDNTADAAKPVSAAQQTALDAKLNASVLDTDATLAANSDSRVTTQKATKAYVDAHAGGSESTPALSEDTTMVSSSKKFSVAGTQTDFKVLEGTPVVVAGENHWSVNASTHRPAYSYNGGAAKDVAYVGDSVSGSQLPNPGAASLGGVQAKTCSGTDKVSAIGTDGVPVCSSDQTATGGSGDVSSNTSSSVDSEIALFSGTGGKTIKRATGTGFVKLSSGVMQTPAVLAAADIPAALSSTTSVNGTSIPASATLLTTGSTVALAKGGTNADLSATGPGFLKQAAIGANVTVAAIAAADLPAALANSTSINGVTVTAGKTLMYTDTSVQAGQMPALTGDATTSSGAVATTLAAPFKKRSCEIVVTGTGTSNVLQSGDDTPANNSCFNKIGVTETIVGVYCKTDGAGTGMTVNPTFGATGTGTTILTGALTCGSSDAYSATGTIGTTTKSLLDGNGIRPVMGGTLTGTNLHLLIVYTVPAS